ncbi:MAG TPA: outer membrane lipoprotein carrier protein LolA [Pyrinomonadaceae bacterium]|jgi:outer membrane lipoprotein-sorting protein|nr:outer membrane lipoprotein carrier protein LolA [Pyrinomonadaceae bacterium]
MKRLIPAGLLAAFIISAMVFVFPATSNGQGAGLVSSVLNRMEKNRQTLKSLRAGISMVKYNSQLGVEDKYSGVVIYMPTAGRQAAVRIDWSSPRRESLAVNNNKYTIFRPALNVAYTGDSRRVGREKTGGLMEMMNMSRQQLEARFQPVKDVREETLWGGVSTIHLTLVPKGNAGYKYAEVWIDNAGMPVQTKIVEKNDDSTTVRLTGLEKNQKLNSSDFDIKLDSNVKIVKS